MMPMVTWGMSALEDKFTAHGTALLTSLRTVSGAIGSAVLVSIMTVASKFYGSSGDTGATIDGMDTTFFCIAVIAVVQFLIAIFSVERKNPFKLYVIYQKMSVIRKFVNIS